MEGFKTRCFIDTNVLIDVLDQTRPHSCASSVIFQAAKSGLMEVFLSIQSILDASYILLEEKGQARSLFNSAIAGILTYVNIISPDTFELRNVLSRDKGDFEDDIIFEMADYKSCDFLITSDKSFINRYDAKVPVMMDPETFVSKMN